MAVPEINEDLCYTPAVDLAQLSRDRKLSPVEVIDAFIERIDAINPKLNAYTTVHHDPRRPRLRRRDPQVHPLQCKPVAWGPRDYPALSSDARPLVIARRRKPTRQSWLP